MAFLGIVLVASGWQALGVGWMTAGVVGVTLCSLPIVGRFLISWLDQYPPLPSEGPLEGELIEAAEALVILDGGGRQGAREYGGATVRNQTLERLRYGAFLHQRRALPVMVSGNGFGHRMGEVLTTAFATPVRWCEQESRNTWENARAAAEILHPEEIRRVILITHFWHMPRAAGAFEAAGFEVLPAPMGFRGSFGGSLQRISTFLPGVMPMRDSYLFLHEIVGLAWYRLRYGLGSKRARF